MMAMSTASKARSRGAKPAARGGRGAAGGARPVGVGKRSKPNPILLGGLGLVAVAGLAKVAMPSLFGGGGTSAVASFPAPLTNRHLVDRLTTPTTVASTSTAAAQGRSDRDPFTPPAGFGRS
jgi:hypothetical protein